MSKAVRRNVKKIVEKINHTSKLRTDIPAQMAVGKFVRNQQIQICKIMSSLIY
jgi:hypothetical protein